VSARERGTGRLFQVLEGAHWMARLYVPTLGHHKNGQPGHRIGSGPSASQEAAAKLDQLQAEATRRADTEATAPR
jgi:hypothetical protein